VNRELTILAVIAGLAGVRLLWSRHRGCIPCAAQDTVDQIRPDRLTATSPPPRDKPPESDAGTLDDPHRP
jgi:hypothetical protein